MGYALGDNPKCPGCGRPIHAWPCQTEPGWIWVQDFDREYGRAVAKTFGGNRKSWEFRLQDGGSPLNEAKQRWLADPSLTAKAAARQFAAERVAAWQATPR
jgi:hypothetical protein